MFRNIVIVSCSFHVNGYSYPIYSRTKISLLTLEVILYETHYHSYTVFIQTYHFVNHNWSNSENFHWISSDQFCVLVQLSIFNVVWFLLGPSRYIFTSIFIDRFQTKCLEYVTFTSNILRLFRDYTRVHALHSLDI